jgi:hypothetical protein
MRASGPFRFYKSELWLIQSHEAFPAIENSSKAVTRKGDDFTHAGGANESNVDDDP